MILFRTDASQLIGSGHVMRTITLAKSFSAKGLKCAFACRSHEGNLISFIRSQFECFDLGTGKISIENGELHHSKWLGVTQEEDAKDTIKVLNKLLDSVSLVVVDHYSLDYRWEKIISSHVEKIFVIDDIIYSMDYAQIWFFLQKIDLKLFKELLN